MRIALGRQKNKGYGTECVKRVLDFAFDDLKLNKVELEVYDFNPRAIHVYEKVGFKIEGRKREVFYRDGLFHDLILMGILVKEYRAKSQREET